MVISVTRDLMSGVSRTTHQPPETLSHLTQEEEGRMDAMYGKDVEKPQSVVHDPIVLLAGWRLPAVVIPVLHVDTERVSQ
jgi:hypothetical protein